jgi:hypothetical protein
MCHTIRPSKIKACFSSLAPLQRSFSRRLVLKVCLLWVANFHMKAANLFFLFAQHSSTIRNFHLRGFPKLTTEKLISPTLRIGFNRIFKDPNILLQFLNLTLEKKGDCHGQNPRSFTTC